MNEQPENMRDLTCLAACGFTDWEQLGSVRATCQDGLILLNYTTAAQFEGRWNWLERVCRGLILDAGTGLVVARPFDKFWNWGEGGQYSEGQIVSVTEKIDGSLGIGYHWRGEWKVATRGSFDSEQAQWARDHLARYYGDLAHKCPPDYTLLWEIIYPENRIVVDYGGDEGLFLLAMRHRHTGIYQPWSELAEWASWLGFPTPRIFTRFHTVEDILGAAKELDAGAEGWVIEFDDGQRFKIKGDRYVELHRLLTGTTFRRVLEAVSFGTYHEMIAGVPDEFLDQIRGWKADIDAQVAAVKEAVEIAFAAAPAGDRKTFALWAREHHLDLMPFLFQRLDGRDYTPLIYKKGVAEVERHAQAER